MNQYLIDFQNLKWEKPKDGVRHKVYIKDNHKIRLVEFSEGFFEKDWCTKGHIGYLLKGRLTMDFNGTKILFKEGDGIFIPEGEESKHKAQVANGETASLILFEKV